MPIIYKFVIHIGKPKKKAISDCSWIGGSAICPLTEKDSTHTRVACREVLDGRMGKGQKLELKNYVHKTFFYDLLSV